MILSKSYFPTNYLGAVFRFTYFPHVKKIAKSDIKAYLEDLLNFDIAVGERYCVPRSDIFLRMPPGAVAARVPVGYTLCNSPWYHSRVDR